MPRDIGQIRPILFVLEDNPDDVSLIINELAPQLGFQVHICETVEQAVSEQEMLSVASVAIVDLMVGKSLQAGWRFLKQVTLSPDTQVIVFTAHPGVQDSAPPEQLGVRYEFCRKGKDTGKVMAILRSQAEKHKLRREGLIVSESAADRRLYANLPMVARSGMSVLVTGPSGCGKEDVAQRIARLSLPATQHNRIETVNCAALTENIALSTLFGYTEHAFTGAKPKGDPGVLRRISGKPGSSSIDERLPGILILDEVAELPIFVQAQLLRMLEGHEIHPFGETKQGYIPVVRIIACTNDEEKLIQPALFRPDLLGRLDGWHISVGPPHERKETFRKAALAMAHEFQMVVDFGEPPIKISSIDEDVTSVVDSKLVPADEGGLRFGFRELKGWVGRACSLALFRVGNDTRLTAGHLREAWDMRMTLADPVDRPLAESRPRIEDLDPRKVADARRQFAGLLQKCADAELPGSWGEQELREVGAVLRRKDPAVFSQLVALKKKYTRAKDGSRILYSAVIGEQGNEKERRAFLARLRQHLREPLA